MKIHLKKEGSEYSYCRNGKAEDIKIGTWEDIPEDCICSTCRRLKIVEEYNRRKLNGD